MAPAGKSCLKAFALLEAAARKYGAGLPFEHFGFSGWGELQNAACQA